MVAYRLLAAAKDAPSPFTDTVPATSALGGSSPMSASSAVVLPHPDSPTSPSRSPALDPEADALDRMQPRAIGQVEPDVQPVDLQQAHATPGSSGGAPPRR